MLKVQNNNRGDITLSHDDGRKTTLVHGINEEVPDWIAELKYAEGLAKAGVILVVERVSYDDDDDGDIPPLKSPYKLDPETGNPIQAIGDDGELMFDEETGNPIFVPADEE